MIALPGRPWRRKFPPCPWMARRKTPDFSRPRNSSTRAPEWREPRALRDLPLSTLRSGTSRPGACEEDFPRPQISEDRRMAAGGDPGGLPGAGKGSLSGCDQERLFILQGSPIPRLLGPEQRLDSRYVPWLGHHDCPAEDALPIHRRHLVSPASLAGGMGCRVPPAFWRWSLGGGRVSQRKLVVSGHVQGAALEGSGAFPVASRATRASRKSVRASLYRFSTAETPSPQRCDSRPGVSPVPARREPLRWPG